MSRKYKAVVWDLDGTLLDTSEGVLSAVSYVIEKEDLKPLSREEILTFIGPPIQKSFVRVYGVSEQEAQRLANIFRDRYKGDDLLKAKPYEEIYETLESMRKKGLKLAVATYKREDYAVRLLKHYDFHHYMDVMYGADNQNKLSKADIIRKSVEDMGVSLSDAVMVGDSDNDAVGAAGLGMDFIGVTYGFGFHSKQDVMQFQAIGSADKAMEILSYV